jgi:hypothetical protein
VRPTLDRCTIDTITERLADLLTTNQPFTITSPEHKAWVAVRADLYDTMLSSWSFANFTIEQQRQQAQPSPPL